MGANLLLILQYGIEFVSIKHLLLIYTFYMKLFSTPHSEY